MKTERSEQLARLFVTERRRARILFGAPSDGEHFGESKVFLGEIRYENGAKMKNLK